jgi:hypothetical protein
MGFNRRAIPKVTDEKEKANARHMTISATRHLAFGFWLLAAGVVLFFAIPNGRTQQNGVQHASDFTSVEYFEPPHQQQMKSRLSGAEAQPQAGGLLVIKQLKLETFNMNGKPEMIVNAPECVYDTFNRVASSPGHLKAQTGDGKFRVEGDGFLWRQNDSLLIISNRVQTVIDNSREMKTVL